MSEPDVVAELEAAIAAVDEGRRIPVGLARRARDEIVALRLELDSDKRFEETVRAEALEEAAREAADAWLTDHEKYAAARCAAAIRALKDKPE